eukprot:m.354010 g.354010  ORF g.354010 m.354010 type:complete len:655 (-) comp16896_c0_seq1:234-2198(-)
MDAWPEKLSAHLRIDREKAVDEFVAEFAAVDDIREHITVLHTLLTDSETWEAKHGALLALAQCFDSAKDKATDEEVAKLATAMTSLLTHKEFRIRTQSGITLGAMASVFGARIYVDFARDVIWTCIADNIERHIDEAELDVLRKRVGADASATPDALLYESAGWKTLDTGFKALLEVTKGVGEAFAPFVTQELISLVFAGLKHTNRFVRETGYYVCAELVQVIREETSAEMTGVPFTDFCDQMSQQLAIGLADNWSQVRMASSVATRKFLLPMNDELRARFFPLLIPRMALNRYYVAEGVRIYSQESWAQVAKDQGREIVATYIKETVEFYIEQSQADNHAVREAACACIAELGGKIDPAALEPYVITLLECLEESFQDDSWPVRDAACIASGRFLGCFPEKSMALLDKFLTLFFHHLGDNIWSVRENAAVALGRIAPSFPSAVPEIEAKLKELLPSAQSQVEDSAKHSGLQNATLFGVAQPLTKETDSFPDPEHTNQQMYSCGSLAPKLKRKGGCMDCGYHRPQELWEKSDGCIYLMRELAASQPRIVKENIQTLADLSNLRHFKHHVHLLETLWKQLPIIAKGAGKSPCKAILETIIPNLAYSLKGDHPLSCVAAQECTQQLAGYLGPSILAGRIELIDDRLLPLFQPYLHR